MIGLGSDKNVTQRPDPDYLGVPGESLLRAMGDPGEPLKGGT